MPINARSHTITSTSDPGRAISVARAIAWEDHRTDSHEHADGDFASWRVAFNDGAKNGERWPGLLGYSALRVPPTSTAAAADGVEQTSSGDSLDAKFRPANGLGAATT